MKLHIMGCHAATPSMKGHPTSQILEIRDHIFLIDCGEGTQVQLRRHKVKFSRINHIFISHLHGDHFFGLPGLISTFQLLGREKELHVYGPERIKEVILLLLRVGNSWTGFQLVFHELTSAISEVIFEDEKVKVSTIPLKHRVYTNGFLFEEKPKERGLNMEAVGRYKVDKAYFKNIKKGKDALSHKGENIPNKDLTFDPPVPKTYAYCSDTAYDETKISWISGADILYHEATFLSTEASLASKTGHSTAKEAALIARLAGVKKLILGHFSTRYKDKNLFLKEAQPVFPSTELAEDGKVFEL
ncbi:RNAse Z [Muriicola jejuensis]|uniref:Ribonuclease Z n=1 Tax=Muriicola jejuensis TaxID=504488 RepID=A0A6P0UCA5_9FLAO|nr:ribonuclease Z [Muriicola jejuensis]NER08953.1 ribonuclease Z [Muriicola jejuensis]SMP12651.1 RNAse Z [Muriicola jejuensis]